MPLPETAFAASASRFMTYAQGTTPLELTPTAGGDAVPFKHDEEADTYDAEQAGGIRVRRLGVFTTTPLQVLATYTYDGKTWTCESSETDRAGSAAFPYRTVLVDHVS